MTHIVTESCIKCKYTDCVDVCPVDCAVCIPECPVNAIYAEEDVPDGQKHFYDLNVELAKSWPSITKTKGPLADAEEWKDKTEKMQYLDRG